MSYPYFTREELWNLVQRLSRSYENLGDSIEKNMRNGSLWDDKTVCELTRNVCAEAERIRNDQTNHLLRSPCGTFDIDLTEAVNAYDETVAILEGVKR
jgi:hypothetical protein